jgi:hypothetical protein
MLEVIEGEEPIEFPIADEENAEVPEVEREILVWVDLQYLRKNEMLAIFLSKDPLILLPHVL